MMRSFVETFAPSGCEGKLSELIGNRLGKKFHTVKSDNMGNLIAISGTGGFCIECGMDSVGIMAVSKGEQEVHFAPVGEVKPADIVGRTVFFSDGTCGKVRCEDDEKTAADAKLSDLYIDMDCEKVKIGDFGFIAPEFCEDEFSYTAYGLKNKIASCALCEAVERAENIGDVTLVISAQKCLGGRGIRGFFGANSFEEIITVDCFEGAGCAWVAKDGNTVSTPWLRKNMEVLCPEIQTVVTDKNFSLNLFAMSCGDPCVAFGIPVSCTEGEPDKVSKGDFNKAVEVLTKLLEK